MSLAAMKPVLHTIRIRATYTCPYCGAVKHVNFGNVKEATAYGFLEANPPVQICPTLSCAYNEAEERYRVIARRVTRQFFDKEEGATRLLKDSYWEARLVNGEGGEPPDAWWIFLQILGEELEKLGRNRD